MSNQESDQEVYATLVEINEEPTALYKILKIANVVSGGGEAKQVISEGYVYVNGEVETRKRKKIYAGDLLSFNDQYFQIAIKGETQDYQLIDADGIEAKQMLDSQPTISENEVQPVRQKKTRKPISF